MQFIYLIILGVLAGIVAAVASMASLVSYPGLLLFGLSPVSANMTNTAALVTTGFGSLSSYLKEMRGNWGELWRYAFFQLTGALIVGWLLVKFPGKKLSKISALLRPFFSWPAPLQRPAKAAKAGDQARKNRGLFWLVRGRDLCRLLWGGVGRFDLDLFDGFK
ncbi:sulfite exporter TauE/SafE family protein [Lactobacillus delbrueckii]